MGIANGVVRTAEFLTKHPVLTIGGAAAVGMYRAHPWRPVAGIGALAGLPTKPFARDSAVADMFLGDPNAVAKISRAAGTKAVGQMLSPYNDPERYAYPPSNGPSGSVVFGMYNDRLK